MKRAPAVLVLVVLVVLDDVGFAQLGCFGSDLDTPVIDRLAGSGLPVSTRVLRSPAALFSPSSQ